MNVTLAAGGTGGHMVPAHALAAELTKRGHGVMLVTDERGQKIPALFDEVPVHVLPAGRLRKTPWGMLKMLGSILSGRSEAKRLYKDFTPDVVVGFGGYPALPALLGASAKNIPTVLHEQNAVLGRVNRLLAGDAAAIATSYETVRKLSRAHAKRTVLVGNPARIECVRIGAEPFPAREKDAPFHLLVTGGSLGASILGEVVPDAIAALPPSKREKLRIVQQCRADDLEAVAARYEQMGVTAECLTYLEDMPERIAWCHAAIARAGASTISELTAAGRPSILVPLPIATDDHQRFNAMAVEEAGAGKMILQPAFTAEEAMRQLKAWIDDPEALAVAAHAARSIGRPRAAQDLADLVERVGNGLSALPVGRAETGPRHAPANLKGAPAMKGMKS